MNLDSLQKVKEFGYSETEARFLELVALHSGLFLRRHYLAFSGMKTGSMASIFLRRLLHRGHARLFILAKNARIYHLFSRQIYDALELSNLRHRRKHGIDYVKTKLLIMDYVLENPGFCYLPTEEEKVEFFTKTLRIPIEDFPAKIYQPPHAKQATTRYFIEKFPLTIGRIGEEKHNIAFHYVDPGPYLGIADFINYLRQYRKLFAHFNPLRLVYIHQKTSKLAEAERLFANFEPALEEKGHELSRFFSLREKWEAGQYATLSQADLKFFTLAKKRFAGAVFEQQYAGWKERKNFPHDATKKRQLERYFTPYKVGGSYDFFGELG
jgi:hypothetical protein